MTLEPAKIVVEYLPCGAVLCYNEDQPVSEEEKEQLNLLFRKIGKVLAISTGIPEETDNDNTAESNQRNQ